MTITYTLEVSRAQFWGFPKLLIRWRGSIYKLIYREMLVFTLCFYIILFAYRFVLTETGQRKFEQLALYCRMGNQVVVTFTLGIFVSLIMQRWWNQYMHIPWPDKLAMEISAYVQGNDERGRMMRRSMVRYLNLLAIFTFQATSTVIKKRFPTLDHLVDAGLMTPEEKEELDNTATPHGYWWMPAHWFCQLAIVARKEGRIHDDLHLKSLIDDCMEYRGNCGMIWSYDWISAPLVYTQVVTISVYMYCWTLLFGRQYLLGDGLEHGFAIDYYVPVMATFEFVFYVGWLKVAESMICPFGEDDDDFELNWIIDRNVQVGYLIVDGLHRRSPAMSRDAFWGNMEPEVPYTQATAHLKKDAEAFVGSTTAMNIPDHEALWEHVDEMPVICEEDGQVQPRRGRKDTSDTNEALDVDDSDNESQASKALDRKKKTGLGGLMPGFSRQTLASRVGSKFGSVNSIFGPSRHSATRPSTPPVPFMRHFSNSATERPMSSFYGRNRNFDNFDSQTDVDCDSKTSIEAFTNFVNDADEMPNPNFSSANLEKIPPLPVVKEVEVESHPVTQPEDTLSPLARSRRLSWADPPGERTESEGTPPLDDCGSTTPLCRPKQ